MNVHHPRAAQPATVLTTSNIATSPLLLHLPQVSNTRVQEAVLDSRLQVMDEAIHGAFVHYCAAYLLCLFNLSVSLG